jgi:hypothetical protein
MFRQTVVVVGPDTPLSWLLDIKHLHVEHLILDGAQMYQIMAEEEEV